MRIVVLLCSFLLYAAGGYAADRPDAHLASARIKNLCSRSAFVHGYLHGYEEGFYQGDLDLQIGRGGDVSNKRIKAGSGYRREFGDKKFFETGYRNGYNVGYADGISGRVFRAVNAIVEAGGLETTKNTLLTPSRNFDAAFSTGYRAGEFKGLADGRHNLHSASTTPPCPAQNADGDYCATYVEGYRMGYSDGYVNQAHPDRVQARK